MTKVLPMVRCLLLLLLVFISSADSSMLVVLQLAQNVGCLAVMQLAQEYLDSITLFNIFVEHCGSISV